MFHYTTSSRQGSAIHRMTTLAFIPIGQNQTDKSHGRYNSYDIGRSMRQQPLEIESMDLLMLSRLAGGNE